MNGPHRTDEALEKVMPHFDDVYNQLQTQMTRLAEIQQQVDRLAAKVAKLEKP